MVKEELRELLNRTVVLFLPDSLPFAGIAFCLSYLLVVKDVSSTISYTVFLFRRHTNETSFCVNGQIADSDCKPYRKRPYYFWE